MKWQIFSSRQRRTLKQSIIRTQTNNNDNNYESSKGIGVIFICVSFSASKPFRIQFATGFFDQMAGGQWPVTSGKQFGHYISNYLSINRDWSKHIPVFHIKQMAWIGISFDKYTRILNVLHLSKFRLEIPREKQKRHTHFVQVTFDVKLWFVYNVTMGMCQ